MENKALDNIFGEEKIQGTQKDLNLSNTKNNQKRARISKVTPRDLGPSYFVSAGYDGGRKSFYLGLYEPRTEKIHYWYDTTGHQPYCLTDLHPNELAKIKRLVTHTGFDRFETVEKYDGLLDRKRSVTKIISKDPLAIGGNRSNSIRNIIPEEWMIMNRNDEKPKIWEAFIRYYQCYIFDRDLAPGMKYEIKDGDLKRTKEKHSEEISKEIQELFRDEPKDSLEYIEYWAQLLESPVPKFRRVAIDIEVFSPIATRVPDPIEALYPVIAVALVGSDQKNRVLLLKREDEDDHISKVSNKYVLEYYDTEKELISEVFKTLWDYPFVVTFNGDEFDLPYLKRRAQRFGLKTEEIPIEDTRRACRLKQGIHIDLYKFFFNRSIQIYAFSQLYRGFSLNDIGEALVGMPKLELETPISELSYEDLAQYCFQDTQITFKLTSFDDDLVMKLILILSRISHMPIEDVSRQGVSRWILNFLHYEHRRRNMLIPNTDDILALKGETSTTAIIKGKKYKGAIVVDPTPGVHFNVDVMDFSSLYPSIIKVHNLGYQSILCPHEECRENKVPDTTHWICKKNRALESLLIGSLRDLRVKWYKPKSKNKRLPRETQNWYNVIQSALKVILNASYGVFGSESFSLYCPPVAEATAAYGRHAITETIRKARELKIIVLYGDTDSVFLRNPSSMQIRALQEWSKKQLGMELELDKSYRYSVLSSRKKNYIGVFSDGRVDIKGMAGKKIHIPSFIKKAFQRIVDRLGEVKNSEEFDKAKTDIRRIVQDCYSKLDRHEYKPEELAFHVVLGKTPKSYTKTTPQHVKAALILQEAGREVKAGDRISFVKVSRDPHVKPVEFTSRDEVDTEKYVGHMQSIFNQILDPLEIDFDEIRGVTRLERWI